MVDNSWPDPCLARKCAIKLLWQLVARFAHKKLYSIIQQSTDASRNPLRSKILLTRIFYISIYNKSSSLRLQKSYLDMKSHVCDVTF